MVTLLRAAGGMVFTVAVRDGGRPGWTRRAVLATGAAAAAGTLSGCGWFAPAPEPPPPPDALEPLLAGTRGLVERYQRVLAVHPELAGRLRPLHRAHQEHAAALLAAIGRPELATPSPGSGSWTPPLDGGSVPAEPAAAVAQLHQAERAGQAEAAQACLAAPPEPAALLGSITAARASHAEVLDE